MGKIEILLTNEQMVRGLTNIDNNVQSKFLLSAIRESQEIGLQEIIGTPMLNKLKEIIHKGTVCDDENIVYKALLDEIQLYLAYACIVKLCLITSVKISNGGLQQNSDENLTVLGISDTLTVQEQYQQKADFFARRLQQYILDNKADLPEISEKTCNGIRANLYSAASTNLWLGGPRTPAKKVYGCKVYNCKKWL